jgi:predicted  nucleic acid-binding Zn-ribbon protein
MPDKADLAQLSLRIATLRERAASARRLAQEITDHEAMQGLQGYADQIEREIEELEAGAAILRQEAHANADEPDIAALKPPPTEPEAEPEPEPEPER